LFPLHRMAQQDFRRINIGLNCPDGIICHQFHADSSGQVINCIDPLHHFRHQDRIGNRPRTKREIGMIDDAIQVLQKAGGQVIDGSNLLSLLN